MSTPAAWKRATGYSDGAARGNPGPSGAGGVLIDESGERRLLGRYLGEQTNNVAEYTAFIMVLEEAAKLGVEDLLMRTDSELLVRQVAGIYKVKAAHLLPLVKKAQSLLSDFDRAKVEHVRRELNKEADLMSNRAIDEKM